MEKQKNRNAFLISCISCIVLVLMMLFLGINSSSVFKGTAAASYSYSSLSNCATKESYYVSKDKKCSSGVESNGYCCPTSDFRYSGGSCSVNYNKSSPTFSDESARADCKSFSANYCINGATADKDGNCCPSGTYYDFGDDGYCVKSGYDLWPDPSYTTGVGEPWVCRTSSSSSSSSSSACYCVDNEDGEETCKKHNSNPGGSWTLSNDSKCSVASSSSSSSSDYACYCVDNEEGEETCQKSIGKPSGNWTLSDDSKCSSGSSSSSSVKQCYQCNSPDYLYKWSDSEPDSSLCSSDWHTRNDYTNQASCEANTKKQCYACSGGVQGGSYVWGSVLIYEATTSCKVQNGVDEAGCDALKNAQVDNRCKGKDYAGRSFVSYTGIKTHWTKQECNNMVKDGYCHIWDDTNNCCGVTEGSWCRSGGGGGSNSSSSIPSSSSVPSSSSSSSKVNVEDNPDTGEITIFIMWVLGLAAIVYSFWYFKKMKES